MQSLLLYVAPVCLAVLLSLAVHHDLRSRRIPNRIVAAGMACAALLQWGVPGACHGVGNDDLRWHSPLAGGAVGLAVLMPLYVLGLLGAGDVKLMGMVGTFAGPRAVWGITLATLVAGGFVALWIAVYQRQLRQSLVRAAAMLVRTAPTAAGTEPTRGPQMGSGAGSGPSGLPYAAAIAGGTWLYLGLRNWLATSGLH